MEIKVLQLEDNAATVDFIQGNFERNLTERGWKPPAFRFSDVDKQKKNVDQFPLAARRQSQELLKCQS